MAKILVVDDRPVDREFLVTLLGYGGHSLLAAADGMQALAAAVADPPDLIISDILMPTMDGYEFARRLRADPRLADIPLVFYTANYREREARRLAEDCGVSYVLTKPVAPEVILQTVQDLVGQPGQKWHPVPSGLARPPGPGRLGSVGEELAGYGSSRDAASQLMAAVDGQRRELAAEEGKADVAAGHLSKTVDHLQTMSLRLTMLVEMGIEISAERDPARLMGLFCRAAQEICVAKYAAAALVEAGELRYLTVRGMAQPALEHFPAPAADSLLGLAMAERRPRRIRSAEADPAHLGLPPGHPPVASFLAVPLVSADGACGWLYLADRLGAPEFSETDEQMAMTLATQAAVNYRNLNLYGELQRRSTDLEREVAEHERAREALRRTLRARTVMAECSRVLIHSTDEASLCEAMCRVVVEQGGYRMAWIGFAGDEGLVRPVAHAGHEAGYLQLLQVNLAAAAPLPAAVAIRTGRSCVVADLATDPAYEPWREAIRDRGYGSVAAMPLGDGARTFGALSVIAAEPRGFEAEQLALFEELAGDIAYGIVSLRHRQAREAAEAALGESRQRFAGILESAMDAIISIGPDQRIVLFNGAAEAMFRCPAAEALGSSIEDFIPARFRAGHAGHVRHFEHTGVTNRAMGHLGTLTALRRDGSEFPIEASISQITVGGQRLFTVILRDITDRLRAEGEIRRLNADLERRVEERTAELGRANEALLNSNLELQRFAHVAAHDLQTPLRSIVGFAQLLRQESQGQLGERGEEWLSLVADNAQRMQTLIQDLLAYSRLDSQARPRESVDFRRLFEEVKSTLAGRIAETGAEVTCGDLPTVRGDRTQMAQVLQNLVENGIKYNQATPPRVHVSAERQGEAWVFAVADNGIGIDPRYHQRIFEVFRRLHSQQDYPGTGIGLAICQRVVESHGGRIWVESKAGAGSVFHFSLPATVPAAQPASLAGGLR